MNSRAIAAAWLCFGAVQLLRPAFCGEAEAKAAPGERKVIAVAMAVARTKGFSGEWRTWQNNRHDPDRRGADGRRDISSVNYPSIGIYDVSDPAYIECACQLMSLAGFDAITFYTPNADDTWHLAALARWVEVMKAYGLSGMPRPQPKSTIEGLDRLLEVFRPVAFTHRGRPLIPFFNIAPERHAALTKWKEGFSPATRPILVKWLVQTCKPPFDGGFDWVGDATHSERESSARNGWKRWFDARLACAGYESDLARARRLLADGSLSVYIEGVNPGFDDSAVNGWGRGNHYIERDGGETYRYRWSRVVENGFALACVPTWDDWGEASIIEPTVEFGNLYLELTREYAAKFKGVAPRTGNFDVPQWIYLVRKSSKDPRMLDVMQRACALLRENDWTSADAMVRPIAISLGLSLRIYR